MSTIHDNDLNFQLIDVKAELLAKLQGNPEFWNTDRLQELATKWHELEFANFFNNARSA